MAVHGAEKDEDREVPPQVLEKITSCLHQQSSRIDLSRRNMKNFPESFFDLSHVQYVYLSDNKLQQLPEVFTSSFMQIVWLDLRSNQLIELPQNIALLKNLKNLLLDDNKIEVLPLQLGLLHQLSGLNLSNNPLSYPPKKIIEAGTKRILSYLREQLAIEQRFGNLELDDAVEKGVSKESYTNDFAENENFIEYSRKFMSHTDDQNKPIRRQSLDDDFTKLQLPYSVNSMLISSRHVKHFVPPLRVREYSSAPVRKIHQRNLAKQTQSASHSKTKTAFQQEVEKAEKKRFNEKADAIIQKQKNKKSLDDWRRHTKDLQRLNPKETKHEIPLPYGNNRDKSINTKHPHAEYVENALTKENPKTALKELRDQQLQARIKEHFNNIKGWKNATRTMTPEEEVRNAKKNLDEALKLQKEFEEKRALEYRLRAFTAEEYSPKNNQK